MPMSNLTRSNWLPAAILALLMLITRFDHVGSAVMLPDASWAVFFLLGYYLRQLVWLGAFLLLAGAIDCVATTQLGVSDWCITPAYLFLIPAYAAMWFGGRWLRRHARLDWRGAVLLTVTASVSVGVTFAISNLGFYWFSGRFESLSLLDYALAVSVYFAAFWQTTLAYLALAAALHVSLAQLRQRADARALPR